MKKNANRIKIIIISFLSLITIISVFVVLLLFLVDIQWSYPNITYKGDRNVPEEDVFHLEKITVRDLKIGESRSRSNKIQCYKCYLIKKNTVSRQELHKELLTFCTNFYNSQNEFDEITFNFFKESNTMPWFWNNEGYFPDLEWNQKNKVAGYTVCNNGVDYWLIESFFSKETTGHIDRKFENTSE